MSQARRINTAIHKSTPRIHLQIHSVLQPADDLVDFALLPIDCRELSPPMQEPMPNECFSTFGLCLESLTGKPRSEASRTRCAIGATPQVLQART